MYSWHRSQEIKGAKACKVCIFTELPAFQITIFPFYKKYQGSPINICFWWLILRKPGGIQSIHYYKTCTRHSVSGNCPTECIVHSYVLVQTPDVNTV